MEKKNYTREFAGAKVNDKNIIDQVHERIHYFWLDAVNLQKDRGRERERDVIAIENCFNYGASYAEGASHSRPYRALEERYRVQDPGVIESASSLIPRPLRNFRQNYSQVFTTKSRQI